MNELVIPDPPPNSPPSLRATDIDSLVLAFLDRRKKTTRAAYDQGLRYFAAFLGLKDPGAAMTELIGHGPGPANMMGLNYANHMAALGLAPASICVRLAALRLVCETGAPRGQDHLVARDRESTRRTTQGLDRPRYQGIRARGRRPPASEKIPKACATWPLSAWLMTWPCAEVPSSNSTWPTSNGMRLDSRARSNCS